MAQRSWRTPSAFLSRWAPGAAQGTVAAVGRGCANGLRQFHCPRGVGVNQNGAVLVADADNFRVVRWVPGATQGAVVAGGRVPGSGLREFDALFAFALEGVMAP